MKEQSVSRGIQRAPASILGSIVAVLLCAVPWCGRAQDSTWISDIRFEGLPQISGSSARQILPTRIPAHANPDSLRKFFRPLLEYYEHSGYYFVRIDSLTQETRGGRRSVAVWLREGPRTLIDSLGFDGMLLFSYNEALPVFDTKPNNVLIDDVLERDIDRLISAYAERGYPFASISIEKIVQDTVLRNGSAGLEVVLRVVEGPHVNVNRVEIVGNTTTHADVILRESRITAGEEYRASEMNAVRQRLLRLGFFSSVEEPELVMTDQGTAIRIRVTEAPMNTFDGIIGYLPPQGNQGGVVTGLANVLLKNMFGTGRRLSARWQHDSPLTQELQLQYIEPWIAGLPLNIGLGFFQRQQDTTYVQRTYDVKTEVMAFDRLTLSGLLFADQVIPSASQVIQGVQKSSSVSVGFEIRYDNRDDPAAPNHGYLYQNDIQVGRKTIASSSEVSSQRSSIQRYALDFQWYCPTFTHQVLATALHARELRSGAITQPDLYRFGGAQTLRGYRENQFLGSRLVWSTLEYRLSTGRRSFADVFTDVGYYYYPGNQLYSVPAAQAWKVGYGIGFQFETGLGILRVSYALGQGDTFTTGKIHFGIINDF